MQAAVVNVLGQPPAYQSFPDPAPGEGEVLIHVRAAGLHPIVKGLAAGTHYASSGELPMVPGLDGVGTLEDGSRVYFAFARRPWGAMGELSVAPRNRCLPVPAGLDDAVAAAIANPGMSAWLSLKNRAAVSRGESVLILGATGVAGQLAIQAARHLGAKRVVGAGRNVQSLADAGLDAVINLTEPEDAIREAFVAEARNGIDVIIDYLWGRPTELLLEALARGFRQDVVRSTRLVEVGASAGSTIHMPAAILRSMDLKILGSGFGAVDLAGVFAAIPRLFDLANEGVFRIHVDRVPLSDVTAAWTRKMEGSRIVFLP